MRLRRFSNSLELEKRVMHVRPLLFHRRIVALVLTTFVADVAIAQDAVSEAEAVVVSATRFEIPLDQSPATVSEINSAEIETKQIERVSDALREVPGLSVVQTGAPGQLTSVFTRGLNSNQTQVMLDGIPINQGLSGGFNFADLTTDNIGRIEVARGPQSTIYGPSAMAGVIQIFTKEGQGTPGVTVTSEGGSYDTFRETVSSDGKIGQFDYSLGASRLDTDNARPNNQYRNSAVIAHFGYTPDEKLRFELLTTYSLSDTGNPNVLLDPRPYDNFLTERWLLAPKVSLQVIDWWKQRFILSYDHERQLNDPNDDGFLFATRALFERTQIDYQNDLQVASWFTITTGLFYQKVNAVQERPHVLFGPKSVSDHTENDAGFLQGTIDFKNFVFVAGGRYDWFDQFGDVWTYRLAGSYKIDRTDTTVHSSVATGFNPPSSQDKIFRFNPNPGVPLEPLQPEENFGWDIGIEQRLWEKRITLGVTYFHNDLSNLIGFNGLFRNPQSRSSRNSGRGS